MITGFLKNNRMEGWWGACRLALDSTEEQRDGIDDA